MHMFISITNNAVWWIPCTHVFAYLCSEYRTLVITFIFGPSCIPSFCLGSPLSQQTTLYPEHTMHIHPFLLQSSVFSEKTISYFPFLPKSLPKGCLDQPSLMASIYVVLTVCEAMCWSRHYVIPPITVGGRMDYITVSISKCQKLKPRKWRNLSMSLIKGRARI